MEKKRASSAPSSAVACPICGRPAEPGLHPFCSRRCADVDLARWLNGVYRVGVDDPEAGIEGGGPDDGNSP